MGDACDFSPARVERAITVAGTSQQDFMLTSSNGGPCVDLLAPGNQIISSWHTSDTATTILTGTSRASSFTAGVAALYLQRHPGATPEQVADAIIDGSSKDKLSGLDPGTPNRLLFSRIK
jgi:subtilisin family serine protease